MLPDGVLLEIFNVYVDQGQFTKQDIEVWQTLVHVCQRWRTVVFGSPRRLNLQLVCSPGTPARDMLDIWPALPLFIRGYGSYQAESVDNILATLERVDRVCHIILLQVSSSHLEFFSAAIQVPFPELTELVLNSDGGVLPDSFLGGCAPRLRHLHLHRIQYLGLPRLLLSATHLVALELLNIPHSGYISPKVMATALCTLTGLERLWLKFETPRTFLDRENRHLPSRPVLPALTSLMFRGVSEYLEDLLALIDAPRLNQLIMTFFNQISFETPRIIQFINRTPSLKALEKAHVAFANGTARIKLTSQTPEYREINVIIACKEFDWQVSSLEQVCTSCLPPLSTLEDLYIHQNTSSEPGWKDNVENSLWLDLLHPFTATKNLYLSEQFSSRIAPALQELVESGRTEEVLPILENIFLERLEPSGPVQEGIWRFVAARQLSAYPITISLWEKYSERVWVFEYE